VDVRNVRYATGDENKENIISISSQKQPEHCATYGSYFSGIAIILNCIRIPAVS